MPLILTTWTCRCGEVFRSWRAAERHANAEHHGGRISVAVPARRPARDDGTSAA